MTDDSTSQGKNDLVVKKIAPRRSPAKRQHCFVLMPFGGWNDVVYEKGIAPAAKASGFRPIRADEIKGPSTIISDIWEHVKEAAVLVAEMTLRNPNVFYELGLAHALGKPVVLMSQSLDDVPFDLRGTRVVLYAPHKPDWPAVLQKSLTTAFQQVRSQPTKYIPWPFLTVLESHAKPVDEHERRLLAVEQSVEQLKSAMAATAGNVRGAHIMRSREWTDFNALAVEAGRNTPLALASRLAESASKEPRKRHEKG